MSDAPRKPLAEVRPIALELQDLLRPSCERIEIAGSIRRNAATVGDIELVAIPRFGCPQVRSQFLLFNPVPEKLNGENSNLLWDEIERLAPSGVEGLRVKWLLKGPIYRRFSWKGVPVDVFTCSTSNWGWILLHRTGPAEFRSYIGRTLRENGLAAIDGRICEFRDRYIRPVRTAAEEDVFELIGMPYAPPESRR